MTERTMKKNLGEYAEVCRQIAQLEVRKQDIAERIKAGMDGKDEIECGGFIARNKAVTTSRFDSKAFKAVYDRLYNEFCKPQTVRRFTVATA